MHCEISHGHIQVNGLVSWIHTTARKEYYTSHRRVCPVGYKLQLSKESCTSKTQKTALRKWCRGQMRTGVGKRKSD